MKFTYEAYEKMIKLILDSGYSIKKYHDYKQAKRPCIIRHDVDMSLEKAAEFSEFESQILGGNGIKSTYFILITSDFYNVFSKRNQQFIKRILSKGHEVGLHFDEKKYQTGDIKNQIFREASLLEGVIDRKIRIVSMHRPSQETLESDTNLDPIINSYGREFFSDFKYVSDSRMHWREDVDTIVRSGKYQKLHILTHPIWYGMNEKTTKQCLIGFLKDAVQDRYIYLDDNFKNLQEYVKKEDIL